MVILVVHPNNLRLNVVFGPEDEGEWQVEFDRVFEEYKDLIDSLLEIHMKEMDISPEQFEDACQMAEGILSTKLHQNLFEQIWAASDFDTFKRMMIQLNIDLQLHALEVLASKYGLVPNSFLFDGVSKEQFQKEDHLFKEAVRRSLAEVEPPAHLTDIVEVHRMPESLLADKPGSDDGKVVPEEEDVDRELIKATERQKSSFFVRKFLREGSASTDRSGDGITVDEIKSRQEYLR